MFKCSNERKHRRKLFKTFEYLVISICLKFDAWNLVLIWILILGIWILSFSALCRLVKSDFGLKTDKNHFFF